MAEWLRRWTRNPLGSSRAGSNPADNVFIILLWKRKFKSNHLNLNYMDFKMKQPNEVRMAEWSRMHSGRRLILQAWVQIHLQIFSQISFDIFVKTLQLFTHGNIFKYKEFRWINYWHKISGLRWLRIDHEFLQKISKKHSVNASSSTSVTFTLKRYWSLVTPSLFHLWQSGLKCYVSL